MTGDPEAPAAVSFGPLLVKALLVKAALLVVLVFAADHDAGDPAYQAAREGDANDVVWYLSRGFDSNAYQRLAREGYYDTFSRNYPMGFPLLIRAADLVLDNTQTAAVLVANLNAVLALGAFFLLARHYARRRGGEAGGASLLFACTPGLLAFGTVAYSESTYLVAALLSWWAYLRAEEGDGPRRSLPWLALASLLAGASVMVRHWGAPVFVALALMEGWRLVRASGGRGRALGEAATVLWAGVPVAAYFLWKFDAHGLGELQEDIWQMHFAPLGGPASLVAMGTAPEYVAQIYLSIPLVLLLGVKLLEIDGRLALLSGLLLFLTLSFTGLAA